MDFIGPFKATTKLNLSTELTDPKLIIIFDTGEQE